jgi:hypothetical protein
MCGPRDFIFDRTDKGSTLKMLTMLDEYTRQCVAIRVDHQMRSLGPKAIVKKSLGRFQLRELLQPHRLQKRPIMGFIAGIAIDYAQIDPHHAAKGASAWRHID